MLHRRSAGVAAALMHSPKNVSKMTSHHSEYESMGLVRSRIEIQILCLILANSQAEK